MSLSDRIKYLEWVVLSKPITFLFTDDKLWWTAEKYDRPKDFAEALGQYPGDFQYTINGVLIDEKAYICIGDIDKGKALELALTKKMCRELLAVAKRVNDQPVLLFLAGHALYESDPDLVSKYPQPSGESDTKVSPVICMYGVIEA